MGDACCNSRAKRMAKQHNSIRGDLRQIESPVNYGFSIIQET
jgi:hypothetical protein